MAQERTDANERGTVIWEMSFPQFNFLLRQTPAIWTISPGEDEPSHTTVSGYTDEELLRDDQAR